MEGLRRAQITNTQAWVDFVRALADDVQRVSTELDRMRSQMRGSYNP